MNNRRTAPRRSLTTFNGPGGTCFPGIPVTLNAGFLPAPPACATPTSMLSKKSSACTCVKASPGSLLVRCAFAWGVVMMGRSRRSEASTSWSKWSLRVCCEWDEVEAYMVDSRVVVGEEDQVDAREVVQVDSRVCLAGARYTGSKVYMVAGVQEVGLDKRDAIGGSF